MDLKKRAEANKVLAPCTQDEPEKKFDPKNPWTLINQDAKIDPLTTRIEWLQARRVMKERKAEAEARAKEIAAREKEKQEEENHEQAQVKKQPSSFEAWPTLKPKKVRFDPQQVKKFNEKVEELNNDPTLLHKIPLPAKKNNNMSVKKYFRFKPKMSDATRRRILIESWRPKPLPMSPEKEEPPNKVAKKEDANEKEDAKDDKEKKPTTGCSKCCKCNC